MKVVHHHRPDEIRVTPAADRVVRHPDGRLLDAKGEWVTNDSYWLRRFDDGDIEAIELPQPAPRHPANRSETA